MPKNISGWRKGRVEKDEINYFGGKGKRLIVEKMFKSKRWDVTLASKTGRQLSRTQHNSKSVAFQKAKKLMKKHSS